MPDFVSYTPVEVNPTYTESRRITFSGPLDEYLRAAQAQQLLSSAETSSPAPTTTTFLWRSGGAQETPYTLVSEPVTSLTQTQTTPKQTTQIGGYRNQNLAQALRNSADYAKSKAGTKSLHRCAHFVSNALEHAGIKGFHRKDGWDYDLVTSELGMQDVTGSLTYMKGDIAVTKTNDGTGHAAICNRDGASLNDRDAWSSDFNSRAHPYDSKRIAYARVFRAKQGLKLIKKQR